MEQTNTQIQTVDSNTEILNITGASNKLTAMFKFIKQNMKKGNDYMSIMGGKPTLLKSGAEKMNILMGYSAEYEKVKDMMNPDKETYYVEIKCILRNKQGQKVAEGIGSCNNQEKARKNMSFYDSLNTVLKMAEKRAYVGATLNANALSQFYTQDLEDSVETKPEVVYGKKDGKDLFGAIACCAKCGKDVSQKVANYSKTNYGSILCMECQGIKEPQK